MLQPITFARRRSAALPIIRLAPPPLLRVPLLPEQAKTLRPPGTAVAAGEPMCVGAGSAPAPAAGTLGPACTATLLGGDRVNGVELHVDAAQASADVQRSTPAPPDPPPTDAPPNRQQELREWIARFTAAAVTARRINNPDLLAQLSACNQRPADTLIVSLLDVEANLPLSAALLASSAAEMAAAILLLARLCGAAKSLVIVGPGTRGKSLVPFEALVRSGRLLLVEVAADYPLADPTVLLQTLRQRRLAPGKLPTDQGVVLLDAAAAVAVGRLALRGEPMLTVPLAVRDHVTHSSYLLEAPLGMPLADVCALLEVPARVAQLRGGELLRQLETPTDAVAGPGELTLHISAAEPPVAPDPCIRCGWCIDACPTGVHPAQVLEAAQQSDRKLAEAHGLAACVGCGICAYVCPARLPLLRAIRTFADT